MVPNTIRSRNPEQKELIVYEFIRRVHERENQPVSFHAIQKETQFTSGTLQSTLKRMVAKHPSEPYKIYEATSLSEATNRRIRVFSVYPSEEQEILDFEQLFEEHNHIMEGKIVKTQSGFILPFHLDTQTTRILDYLVSKHENLSGIGDLFSKAIMNYLQTQVKRKDISEAIKSTEEIIPDEE